MPTRARRPVTATKPAGKVSAVKHFGPTRDVAQTPIVPFSVGFVRDDEVEETHEFDARPRVSYGDTLAMARAQLDVDEMEAVRILDRSLRRFLIDNDGTPTRWTPSITGKTFIDPTGEERPVADLPIVKAFDAGSSRRRWVMLMESDDVSLSVETEQIFKVFEYITEKAAEHAAGQSAAQAAAAS